MDPNEFRRVDRAVVEVLKHARRMHPTTVEQLWREFGRYTE
jgi:hypothetical protein